MLQDAGCWLDAAVRSLPTQRADGVVTVTEHQIIAFQHDIRSHAFPLLLPLTPTRLYDRIANAIC